METSSRRSKTLESLPSSNLVQPIKRRRTLFQRRPDIAKEVCQSLGIDYSDLILKTKEEMYDPKKLKEANELIYDHYMKRYNRRAAQVDAKIKERMSLGRSDTLMTDDRWPQRCRSTSESNNKTGNQENKSSYRLRTYQDSVRPMSGVRPYLAQKSFRKESDNESSIDINLETSDHEVSTNVVSNYKKKLERIQEHWDEQAKSLKSITIGESNKSFNHTLQSQVDKLNRKIEKAEKYAQSIAELNDKRNQINEEIAQKETRAKKLKLKIIIERDKSNKKNQESLKEKMKEIKSQKREYNIKLKKKAQKLQERFQELEERIIKEEDEHKNMVKSKELEFIAKVAKARELKDADYEDIYEGHKKEEARSNRQVELVLSARKKKTKESARSFRESYEKAKEKRETLDTERHSKTIQKIFQKCQGSDQIQELMKVTVKKKHEESLEKEKVQKKNYREILKNKLHWTKSIVESSQKSQERVKEFQEEKSKALALKKELNNFRKLDQAENFSGIMKLREARNSQIIDKERAGSFKISMLREQSFVLSQAKMDVDRKTKQQVDGMITLALKGSDIKKSIDNRKFQRAASAAQL